MTVFFWCLIAAVVSRAIRACFAVPLARPPRVEVTVTTVLVQQPPTFTPLNDRDLEWLARQQRDTH